MSPAVAIPCSETGMKDLEPDAVEKLVGNVTEIPDIYVLPLEHRPSLAPSSRGDEIPVIDLSGLSDDRHPDTLAQIHSACVQWGFFQVVNHGVSRAVMESIKQQVEEFLALPLHERAPRGVKKGTAGQGYRSGFVKPGTGTTDWRDYLLLRTFPETQRDLEMWPKSPLFREVVDQYCREVRDLQHRLLACLSESLGLKSSYLQDQMGEVHQDLLINHYPPCPSPDLTLGANKHTDLGGLTCLWQIENVSGLQVSKGDQWVSVNPLPGAYIINVGDQVEILSNGIYKSVEHRAVVNSTQRRISIVAFYDLNPDAVIRPASELVTPERPAKYQPTVFRDHAQKLGVETENVGQKSL